MCIYSKSACILKQFTLNTHILCIRHDLLHSVVFITVFFSSFGNRDQTKVILIGLQIYLLFAHTSTHFICTTTYATDNNSRYTIFNVCEMTEQKKNCVSAFFLQYSKKNARYAKSKRNIKQNKFNKPMTRFTYVLFILTLD